MKNCFKHIILVWALLPLLSIQAQAQNSPCQTSLTGKINNVSCQRLNGRFYAPGEDRGVEAEAVLGRLADENLPAVVKSISADGSTATQQDASGNETTITLDAGSGGGIVEPDAQGQLRAATIDDVGVLARDHQNLRIGTRTITSSTPPVLTFETYAASNFRGVQTYCPVVTSPLLNETCFSSVNRLWYTFNGNNWSDIKGPPANWIGVFAAEVAARDHVTSVGQLTWWPGLTTIRRVATYTEGSTTYDYSWQPEQERTELLGRPTLTTLPVPVAQGGTGSTSASSARTELGLGTAAVADTGTASGAVPILDANGRLVPGVVAQGTPSNGHVPKWDAADSQIKWQTDETGGASVTLPAQASDAEIDAGTVTDPRLWSPANVTRAAMAHSGGMGGSTPPTHFATLNITSINNRAVVYADPAWELVGSPTGIEVGTRNNAQSLNSNWLGFSPLAVPENAIAIAYVSKVGGIVVGRGILPTNPGGLRDYSAQGEVSYHSITMGDGLEANWSFSVPTDANKITRGLGANTFSSLQFLAYTTTGVASGVTIELYWASGGGGGGGSATLPAQASNTEIDAGTVTDPRSWSPANVTRAAMAHSAGLADDAVTPPKLDADDATKQDAFLTRLNALRRDLDNIATLTISEQRTLLLSLGSLIDGPRPAPSAAYSGRTWIDPNNDRAYVCRNRQEVSTAVGGLWADADTTSEGIEIAENLADLDDPASSTDFAYTYSDGKWWEGHLVSSNRYLWLETQPTDALNVHLTLTPNWTTVWLGQHQWDYDATQQLPHSSLPAMTDYYFYNTRTVTVRKFGRADYSAAGSVLDHWQWELLVATAAEIDIIEARDGNLPPLASDGTDDRQIAVANDGIHFVQLIPEAATAATTGAWASYSYSNSSPYRRYIGVIREDPASSTVGDFYYSTTRHRWRIYRSAGTWAWFNDHWEDLSDEDIAWPTRFVGHHGSRAEATAYAASSGIETGQTFVAFTGSQIETGSQFFQGTSARFSRHWRFLPLNPPTSTAQLFLDDVFSMPGDITLRIENGNTGRRYKTVYGIDHTVRISKIKVQAQASAGTDTWQISLLKGTAPNSPNEDVIQVSDILWPINSEQRRRSAQFSAGTTLTEHTFTIPNVRVARGEYLVVQLSRVSLSSSRSRVRYVRVLTEHEAFNAFRFVGSGTDNLDSGTNKTVDNVEWTDAGLWIEMEYALEYDVDAAIATHGNDDFAQFGAFSLTGKELSLRVTRELGGHVDVQAVDLSPIGVPANNSIGEDKLATSVKVKLQSDSDVTTIADARALARYTATEKTKLGVAAPLDSPALTGTPTAPSPVFATSGNTEIATKKYADDVLTRILAGSGVDIDRTVTGKITVSSTTRVPRSVGGSAPASLSITETLPAASSLDRTLLAAVGGATDTGLTAGPHYRREAEATVVSMRADRLGAGRAGFSTYDLGELGGRRSASSGGSLSPPIPGIATIAVEPNVGVDVHVRDSDRDIVLPSGRWIGATANGPTIWFVTPAGRVVAYAAATGLADSTKNITLSSGTWAGATSDDTTLFFVEDFTNQLHAYTAATRARASSKDITLGAGTWTAAVSDGTTIWVVDSAVAKAWTIATKARASGRDITITAGRDAADIGGAFTDGTTLWFIERRGGDALAYAAANGAREEHKDVALGVGSWNAGTLSGPSIWVVDRQSPSQIARVFSLRSGGGRVIVDSLTGSPIHAQSGPLTLTVGTVEVPLAGPATTGNAGVRRWISGYVPADVILPGQHHTVKIAAASGPISLHAGDWLAPLIDPVLLDEAVLGIEHRAAFEAERIAPVRDVTLSGVPSINENNYRKLSIDHSIPRAWISKQIPAPGTAAFGTSAPWPVVGKYLGAADGGVTAPSADNGYIYYDRFLSAWLYQVRGGAVNQWQVGDIATVTRNKGDFPATYHWLGDQAGAVAAAGFVPVFETGHVYLFFHTSTRTVDALNSSTFTAAKNHTWRYEPRPLAMIEDIAVLRAEIAAMAPEVLVDHTVPNHAGISLSSDSSGWVQTEKVAFNRQLTAADDGKIMTVEMRWREQNASGSGYLERTHTGLISARQFRLFTARVYYGTSVSSVGGSGEWYIRQANWTNRSTTLLDSTAMRLMYSRYRRTNSGTAATASTNGTGPDGIAFNVGMTAAEALAADVHIQFFRIRVTLRK